MTVDTYRITTQPVILLLEFIHGRVKVVEELVLELRVVDEVPLATGVVVAVVVSDAREVKPLRMTKLIACIEHKMLDLSKIRQIILKLNLLHILCEIYFNFPCNQWPLLQLFFYEIRL